MSTVSGDSDVLPAPVPVLALPIAVVFASPQSKASTESQPSKPLRVESPVAPSTLRKYCSGLSAGTGVAADATGTCVVVTALATNGLATASVAPAVRSNAAVSGRL